MVLCDGASLFIALILLPLGVLSIPVQPNMRSFTSAIKNGVQKANVEMLLYEHTEGPGVVTEQWITGLTVDEKTRIRIYIDGPNVTLDFKLYMAHGIGGGNDIENAYIPWHTRLMGHTDKGGALYNTFRIPFQKSIKITATSPSDGFTWYIVRGVENFPVVLGDLQLPPNTRLRLYKNEGILLKKLEFLVLAQISGVSGALFMVTVAGNSTNMEYLEGCFRAVIDGKEMFMSSGTEDLFLSAFYYGSGVYHTNDAGLTGKKNPGFTSMYKFFERDPILFTKSFQLMWRCGELTDGRDGCPSTYPPNPDLPSVHGIDILTDTVVTTYTWVYEWD